MNKSLHVLLVAPNASEHMGGEAVLALHWLRELSALGVKARLLTHARCRAELETSTYANFPIEFLEDSTAEKWIWWVTYRLPGPAQRLGKFVLSLVTMVRLARAVKTSADQIPTDIIHQVQPVSPRLASPVVHKSCPVIIGPMNGNMTYPRGFGAAYGDSGSLENYLRSLSSVAHWVFRGKPRAACLLVANSRTAEALPAAVNQSRVKLLVENGVDLDSWTDEVPPSQSDQVRVIFVGRLVDWKAVDLLIDAFKKLPTHYNLTICGDGEMRDELERQVAALKLQPRIHFTGQVPQKQVRELVKAHDLLVLPSLYECGGAVVLEAMALSRPVVAADWGGPQDYVTKETGILVPPDSESFIRDLAVAIQKLGEDGGLRRSMGEAGRARVEKLFAWDKKAMEMLTIYREAIDNT